MRRLVDEAVTQRNIDVLDELAAGEFADVARGWVRPFQSAFPDFEMRIVELIAEGDKVVGHFKCSGTHLGEWLGVPATGRRFEGVDEIYIFHVRAGKLVSAFGVEDNLTRLHQLGINPGGSPRRPDYRIGGEMRAQDRVCVIGAGSSGIAVCQVLNARGIPFDCFEGGSEVGGNWRYGNDNGLSAAYRSLHINTSRGLMAYRTFPMPEHLPPYPNHWQIAEYFDSYVDHFGFRGKIQFRTEVTRVTPAPAGGWNVSFRELDGGEPQTQSYHGVLVANGHHWDPRWPEPAFPGSEAFEGQQMHAHAYD